MKVLYTLIGIITLSAIIFYIISCKGKSSKNIQVSTQDSLDKGSIKKTKVTENLYPELRNKALTITASELNLNSKENMASVFGVVMDWDIGEAIATVVAFNTGDVSLYISAGQIYIGGIGHENVRNAGLSFINESQSYLSLATMTNDTRLPDKGCVKFYLLTNKGKFAFQETVENLSNNNSKWSKLFDLGNNIITEYRTIIDK